MSIIPTDQPTPTPMPCLQILLMYNVYTPNSTQILWISMAKFKLWSPWVKSHEMGSWQAIYLGKTSVWISNTPVSLTVHPLRSHILTFTDFKGTDHLQVAVRKSWWPERRRQRLALSWHCLTRWESNTHAVTRQCISKPNKQTNKQT